MSITEGKKESTLIETTIGNLIEATFTEAIVLEVTGTKGTLRLDLQAKEISQQPRPNCQLNVQITDKNH